VVNKEREEHNIEDNSSNNDNLYSYQFVSKHSKDSELSFISKSGLRDSKQAANSNNNTPKSNTLAAEEEEVLSGAMA
jgi:hypothetical protein